MNGEKHIGLYSKIENNSGDYIQYSNSGTNEGSFRYYDALVIFKRVTTNTHVFNSSNSGTMNSTYYNMGNNGTVNNGYNSYETTFKNELRTIGVAETEINNIWKYINDTFISSTTIPYPKQNQFVLEQIDNPPSGGNIMGYPFIYTTVSDQSRHVDFGIKLRTNADLWLSKDLYKATVLINGKKQEYMYNKKKSETDSQGDWIVNLNTGMYEYNAGSDSSNRANNSDYIGERYGGSTYTREIRKSEYLYDGSDAGTTDAKNLQVFVTYKISIKNQSQDIWTSVNEIIDYYDRDQFTYDRNSTIIIDNTFVGDSNGNKYYDLSVSETSRYVSKYGTMNGYYGNSSNINGLYNYSALYLTGVRSVRSSNLGNEKLQPGELTYLYITFKVNNDDSGKVKLDQVMSDLLNYQNGNEIHDTLGKKNIAEINGYSTYYRDGRKAGVIDLDSNPGSLKQKDLDLDGNIISSNNSWQNRLEDDTDKANNLKLKIDTSTNNTRSFSGYVFEDARTEVSDGAVIGNGTYNETDTDFEGNKDKKINGVTIQLVELVQEVDAEGFSTGNYLNEHIWSNVYYGKSGNTWVRNEDTSRYYSGTNKSKVILSGQGIFKVDSTDLAEGQGLYKFDSLPPGDFFVRFIYGDTTQTVLTNSADEVQQMLNSLSEEQKENFITSSNNSGILGTSGLNSKAYTGQDYKSTIYQRGVVQNSSVNYHTYTNKSGANVGNGVVGYTNTIGQNYSIGNSNALTPNDKNTMYNYSVAESNKIRQGISDAKDVYPYRLSEKNYSLGSNLSTLSGGMQTLKNHRAEVLASSTELATKALVNYQNKMYEEAAINQREYLKELINMTKMVAQTGVIGTEIEYNRTVTQVFDNNSKQYVQNLGYEIQDLDLGLTERPRAQLNLSKELVNIQIKLANGRILFDANQSVSNLIFQDHRKYSEDEYYYKVESNGNVGYRLRQSLKQAIESRKEELVQATMDEELISGATIRLTYKIVINNIGEVDYLDTDFYYLGKTNNASGQDSNWQNVSKTNARSIIDYVSNEINYESNYQTNVNDWRIITADILLGTEEDKANKGVANYNSEDNDYINSVYKGNLDTFNVLLTTNRLSGDLIPRAIDTDKVNYSNSSREIYLILSTLLENTTKDKNLIFTNLAELIEVQNSAGRRMHFSKVGDQYVPYQSKDTTVDESTTWIKPTEPDSDSSQKVTVSTPTGENKNFNRIIVITIIALSIIIISVIIIKKKVMKDK